MMKDTGISSTVLRQIRDYAERYGVKKVSLFGSRARGGYRRESDIDLAVSGGDADLFQLAVEEETDTLLTYDVIALDRSESRELKEIVETEGIVLYEKI